MCGAVPLLLNMSSWHGAYLSIGSNLPLPSFREKKPVTRFWLLHTVPVPLLYHSSKEEFVLLGLWVLFCTPNKDSSKLRTGWPKSDVRYVLEFLSSFTIISRMTVGPISSSFVCNEYPRLFAGCIYGWSLMLTTHFHLGPKLRTYAVPPRSLYAFMVSYLVTGMALSL
jgi:hypothetical protein